MSKAISNEAKHQRQAILDHLQKKGRLTTLQARQNLAICHPAARVQELREDGFNIITHWRYDDDSTGRGHRVAEYMLMAGGAA